MGNGGFAVAGRAIEKHGAAGVQGRSALLDNLVFEGELAEAAADALKGDQLVGELLDVYPIVKSSRATGAGPI